MILLYDHQSAYFMTVEGLEYVEEDLLCICIYAFLGGCVIVSYNL